MMDITFGICVGKVDRPVLDRVLGSIIFNQIGGPESEVLLIGNKDEMSCYENISKIRIIDFDETQKRGWITRKKNILAQEAKNDIICLTHDYYYLEQGWLTGIIKCDQELESKWDILLNRIYTLEGKRHSDWMVNPNYMLKLINEDPSKYIPLLMNVAPHENHAKFVNGLPYDVRDLSHIQYISGGYVVCKKDLVLKIPMNEDLAWGDGEDLEWSERLNDANIQFHFNDISICRTLRERKWHVYEMPTEFVEDLRYYYDPQRIR